MVGQLAALTAGHGAQMAAAKAEADMKRPGRIKPSSEYLSQRRVEEKLVKQVGRATRSCQSGPGSES